MRIGAGASYSGVHPWRMAFLMAVLGVALVLVAIPLGGISRRPPAGPGDRKDVQSATRRRSVRALALHAAVRAWHANCSGFCSRRFCPRQENHVRSASMRKLGFAFAAILAIACARVPEHFELPELEVKQAEFAATLAAYTGTGVVGGNRVAILLNGEEIFPATLALIRRAKRTVNYAQYYFESGPPAQDMAEALAERCRAGVSVNVLLDAVGSLGMPSDLRDLMSDSGCRVEIFRPLSPFAIRRTNYRNHRRILVVDGVVGTTGGAGVSEKWSGNGRQKGYWRDTDILIDGPVVEQLQGAFAENWLEATGVALGGPEYFPQRRLARRGSVDAQVVRSSPSGGSHAMYTMFLLALAAAQRLHLHHEPLFPARREDARHADGSRAAGRARHPDRSRVHR